MERNAATSTSGSGRWWLPLGVLAAGWGLTAWVFVLLERGRVAREEEYLGERISEAQAAIRVRVTAYVDALLGGTSFIAASRTLDRDEWRIYTASLQIEKRYPGINGLGVILAVRPDQVDDWLAARQAQGEPRLRITPFPNTVATPGQPRYLITYLEGNVGVQAPIGRDIATEPSRRAAAEKARDTGLPQLHQRIPGSRDTQRRSGLLLYVPLYAKDSVLDTVEARRAAHFGWIYAQVYPEVFLQGVLGPMEETLHLHFFEPGGLTTERLLYASAAGAGGGLPTFERMTELELGGQRFQLGWRRGPRFPPADRAAGIWTASSLGLATLLLSGLVWSLQGTSRRANAIAAERTAELAASQRMFQRLFESSPDAVLLADREGRVVRANARAEELFGWQGAELRGTSCAELLPKRGKDAVGRRRDGSEFAAEVTFSSVETDEGVQTLTVVRDVTERRNLEQNLSVARDQAVQASRLKSEFLASMSHEIRTPMNAVLGMAELLAGTPLSEEQRGMLGVMQGGAANLLALVNDILDLSKIEAGKLRLEEREFELRATVEETVAMLTPRAEQKGLILAADVPAEAAVALVGDGGRVRQVLTNLLSNAVKFTERGAVTVSVRVMSATEERVRFRAAVRDTGTGIPRDVQAQLFQPFVQAEGPQRGGTGLGLAISRQLVQAMGGEVGFASEPGQGSEFWFELDVARARGERLAARSGTCDVLIVDDKEPVRVALLRELADLNVEAATEKEAVLGNLRAKATAGEALPLVLIDWQVEGDRGAELARAIRAETLLDAARLVAMSDAPLADPWTATAAGCEGFLLKPVRRDDVLRCLRGSARKPEAAAGAMPGRRLRVLLAEDNRANQAVARVLLRKLGCDVEVVENGADALERLARETFDAVLMDCQMPVLDGYQATRRLRAGEVAGANAHIPVIAVTAYAMPGDREKCLAAGMNEYVTKPVRPAELRAAMERCGLVLAMTGEEAPRA